jgi:hypothetical protein
MAQRWRPNTCGCVLDFTIPKDENGQFVDWLDPSVEVEQVVKCPRHESFENGAVFYHVWLQENATINDCIEYLAENYIADIEKDAAILIEQGVLSFEGNQIVFTLSLTEEQESAFQSHSDATWGAGRVIVR